jgi:hypothetical protein
LGDLTGTSEKIMHFGWTLKPLSEWGDHPIFTIKGFVYFLSELALTFWRGEFFWRFERLASKSADILYFITTLIFGISGLIGIMLESREVSTDKKIFNYLHLFILVSFIMFLALLSIRYDFGNCLYPSKNLPYFTSGRLILASLVSFLIVYVKGIEYITSKFFKRIDPVVIILVIVLYSAFSEITISFDRGVFTSPYNYFNF